MTRIATLDRRPEGLSGWVTMPFRLARRLLNNGVSSTFHRASAKFRVAVDEWRYGLKTERFIPWSELSDDACSVDYEPTTYSAIEHVLSHVEPHERGLIVDYGCGMGRVLAMAIRNGFQEAVGVELSPELCRAAEDNLKRSLGRQASKAKVVCENAVEWNTPDEATVVYLFNPFRGRVLEETLDRIRESLIRRPRDLKLLYLQPLVDENVLAQRPWLELRHEETVEGVRFCVFTARTHHA